MGIAILPDGSRMDYKEYIEKHPHWQAVRKARFKFDNFQCVVCHKKIIGNDFQTHHLNYNHLGNEHMTDVITLCDSCHAKFHNAWQKATFWKGRESGHWDVFNIDETANLCVEYYAEDKFICRDENALNLCNKEVGRDLIDRYMREFALSYNPNIDPNDIQLFVRNKRYELAFDAEQRGLTIEEFLNEYYGQKVRGKNPIRQEAGRYFNIDFKKMHRTYTENPNINKLMKIAKEKEKKYAETK